MIDDIFESPVPQVERDRYGRPVVPLPGGRDSGPCATLAGCLVTRAHEHLTRVSTFAASLDDGIGLASWRARHIALSVARRPDLAARVAGMEYGDPGLGALLEEALERAKDTEASLAAKDWGTAVHRFVEPNSPPHAPEFLRSDVDAYQAMMAREGLTVVMTEQFVVNHGLGVAGTFDHLVRCPDGRTRILDKKTGKVRHLSQAIQLVAYATGRLCDLATGECSDIHPDLDMSIGLIAHIPLGRGVATLHEVDLSAAWHGALAAVQVRSLRSAAKGWFG
jgi:hypothetical protein